MPLGGALAACPAAGEAPIVTIDLREPAAIYTLATADALSAQARVNATPLSRGGGVLGLTVNRYDLGLRIAVTSAGSCTSLHAVTVAVAANPQVLIDGRYAPGTCQRRAITDHEDEHVAVFREAIARAAPALEAALRAAPLPSAIESASEAAAEESYARAIHAALEPVMDLVRRRTADENARIDTPAHYAEVFHRCSAW